ncbi:SDR family NAD(P)-dependent oxidoreductase [Phenylobacterium sp. LjRoot225]|uniref:SDR family NAD(P)-dependent oxidoreductase n=1 Tax=Phenylobacterium sp. LjRoot225 TaxID=3342285 RepID=UPI003ECD415A
MTAPIALVTGASAGMGRDIAWALAAAGYDLGLLGRRSEGLEETAEGVAAAGRRSISLIADVCDATALSAALDDFLAWSGDRVDVLINAAGWTGPLSPPIHEISVEDFDATVATNLRAPFLTLKRLLPVMYAQGAGRIVNMGGNHGMRGRAGRAAFSASKWGLRGLSRTAALEAGPHGVTVNLIAPGPVAVPRMKANWRAQAQAEGVAEEVILARYMQAMGAALGQPSEPQDVVAMVMFLVGEGGGAITGQELIIDGGVIV